MYFELIKFTFKRIFILSVAGLVISVLHDKDWIVALLLGGFCVTVFLRKRKSPHAVLYLVGFLISAIGGVLAEDWGISSGLWVYHDLPDGRNFPYWLPFAWGLAFSFLYSFEYCYIKVLQLWRPMQKIILTILVTALLPTIGEIVTVQMGVWTYYGPYQLFGIPLYAIGLLVAFHTSVFLVLCGLNAFFKMNDPVFSLKKTDTLTVTDRPIS